MVIINQTSKNEILPLEILPLIGIPMTGLLWSAAIVVVNAGQVAGADLGLPLTALLVLAGGMAQTVALWVGFSAILWAMVRGFGKRVTLLDVLRLMSGASWPLWWGAPAIAFWCSGARYQTLSISLIGVTGMLGFFLLTGQSLAKHAGWSTTRACSAVSAAVIFITSFVYLNI